MAGNNSTQFLRGTSAQGATHTETSLAGQPIYETDTNRLYVGDGVKAIKNLEPIGAIQPAAKTTLGGIKNYFDGSVLWISTEEQ